MAMARRLGLQSRSIPFAAYASVILLPNGQHRRNQDCQYGPRFTTKSYSVLADVEAVAEYDKRLGALY
jgi:hypothetical protein